MAAFGGAARTYTDPNTGKTYDTSNPDFSGWLFKQSVWLKDWRQRWFILKGPKLFFAKVGVGQTKPRSRVAPYPSKTCAVFLCACAHHRAKEQHPMA